MNLDDLILLLNELKAKVFFKNDKLIEFIFEQVYRRIKRDDFFVSNRQLLEICQSLCKFHVNNPNIYKSLLIELGKHFFKFNIDQKLTILKSLAERGFIHKDIFSSALEDLSKHIEVNKDMTAEALCYASQLNIEDIEFFDDFLEKVKVLGDIKFQTGTILKLFFLLAKKQVDFSDIELIMNENSFPNNYICDSPRMFLFCYIYYKSSNVYFAKNDLVEHIKKLISPNDIWGIQNDMIIEVKQELIKDGYDVEEFADVEGIQVPFKVKGQNIVIIPLTAQNSLLNNSEIRGEYLVFGKGLKNLNYQVLLYDGKRNEEKLHPIPDLNKTN